MLKVSFIDTIAGLVLTGLAVLIMVLITPKDSYTQTDPAMLDDTSIPTVVISDENNSKEDKVEIQSEIAQDETNINNESTEDLKQEVINSIKKLDNLSYSTSVVYIDLLTGDNIEIKPDNTQTLGSLYKLKHAVAILDTINLDDIKDPLIDDYTADDVLSSMIVYSANHFVRPVELSFVDCDEGQECYPVFEQYFQQTFGKYDFGRTPYTGSTSEVSRFLSDLYNQELLPKDKTDYIIDLLSNTDPEFDDRISGGVPAGTTVAHKVGFDMILEDDDYSFIGAVYNDAGIIYTPSGDYVLSVMIEGADNYESGGEIIRQISNNIYSYHTQK